MLDSEGTELNWADEFNLGSIVEGEVIETKDFGVVISFEEYKDIFGFISQYHCMSALSNDRSLIISYYLFMFGLWFSYSKLDFCQ